MEGKIGKAAWKVESIGDRKDKVWLELKTEVEKENLLKKREEIYKEGKVTIDEWWKEEERGDRFYLLKKAKEMEETAREWKINLKIIRRNKDLEVKGERFKWNREKKELEKVEVKEEDKKEEEEREREREIVRRG